MNRRIILLFACLSLSPLGVRAEEKGPPTFKLSVQPAAEPVPALKYQFIPTFLDQTPGNAALFYIKAAMLQGHGEQHHKNLELIAEWLAKPLAEFPLDAARKMLENYKGPLREIELGAKRERCDWELPLRDGDPFSIILEELQRARDLGRLLALRARLQIAEGKLDEAIATLRMTFVLARHIGEQPTLVSGLVAIAIIHGPLVEQIETLIQTPGAPNLYWALTVLSAPTIDLRPAVQFEVNGVELMFPELQNVETAQRSTDDWQALLKGLAGKATAFSEDAEYKMILKRISNPTWQAKAETEAKKYLVEHGYAADKVQAMSRPQALIVGTMAHFREGRDSLYRWFYVPYWQARAGFISAERELVNDKRDFDVLPLRGLVSSFAKVAFSSARLDRRIAALRTVEALRIYAAAHQGQLPAQLSDVTAIPIPLDPVLGQPFSYQVEGDTATIWAAAPPDRSPEFGGLKYVLKVSKPSP